MMDIAIIGAGGLALETAWLIRRINDSYKQFNIIGFYDDSISEQKIKNMRLPYLGTIEELAQTKKDTNIVLAIGNPKIKKFIHNKLQENPKIFYPNLIANDVIVEDENQLGKGNILFSGVKITVGLTLGDLNLIGFNTAIGHGTSIGSYNSIYPGVTISGDCELDDCIEVGTGSNIVQQMKIKSDIVVGAGAVVTKNLERAGTYVGIPAIIKGI